MRDWCNGAAWLKPCICILKKIELEPAMFNIRLNAPKLARKCEIKHWYACGADKRKVGRLVYHHVITNFQGWIDFLSYGGFAQNTELSL